MNDPTLQTLLFSIFLFLAESEKKRRKERQRLGIQRAKENKVVFGRRCGFTPKLLKDMLLVIGKDLSIVKTYSSLQICQTSFNKYLNLIFSNLNNDLKPFHYQKLSVSRKKEIDDIMESFQNHSLLKKKIKPYQMSLETIKNDQKDQKDQEDQKASLSSSSS